MFPLKPKAGLSGHPSDFQYCGPPRPNYRRDQVGWFNLALVFKLNAAQRMATVEECDTGVGESFRAVLLGGLISATSSTLLIAMFCTAFLVPRKSHDIRELIISFLVVCVFAVIPAGTFGFLAGALGAAWLRCRRSSIHSKGRLLAEAALVGAALGSTFPFIHRAMGWAGVDHPKVDLKAVVLSAGIGVACAVLFPFLFSRFFVTEGG